MVCFRFAVDGLKFIIGELGIGEGGKGGNNWDDGCVIVRKDAADPS